MHVLLSFKVSMSLQQEDLNSVPADAMTTVCSVVPIVHSFGGIGADLLRLAPPLLCARPHTQSALPASTHTRLARVRAYV